MSRLFNGSSDKIDIVGGAFAPGLDGPMTVWCWCRTETIITQGTMIAADLGGSVRNWVLKRSNADLLWVSFTPATEIFTEAGVFTGKVDEWIFCAATKAASGTAQIRLYFGNPGELTESIKGNSGTIQNDSTGIQIGYNGFSGGAEFWDGDLAWCGVDKTTAFNLAELNEISRKGHHHSAPFLILPLWGEDSPEPDLSGNGNSGTISSGTAQGDGPPTGAPFGDDEEMAAQDAGQDILTPVAAEDTLDLAIDPEVAEVVVEIPAADSVDLAIDPEVSDIETTEAKVAADTLGLALAEAASVFASGPAPGADEVNLSDSAEFGPPLTFKEIENDPPDSIVLADVAPSAFVSGPAFTGKTLMLAEIKLNDTLFRAGKGIRHPTRMYVGKVQSFGSIIRSIQVPSGFAQIGDAELTIIDTDGELRQAMSVQPPQNREVVIKIGDEGESESIFQIAYTGIISHVTFPPGLAKIRLKDNTLKFLQEPLPDLLTRDNFTPDPVFANNLRARTEGAFDESEIFSPIVFGELDSTGTDVVGSMNAVRLDSTTFNLTQHPIPHGPIKIFTKFPGETEFLEQAFGFSIVEVAKTIDGVDYIFTHVVFGVGQPIGTEVRWDGEGMTDTGDKDGTAIRNPAEAIKQYLIRIAQREPTEIDLIKFDEVAAALDLVSTGGPSPGYFCDGAITQKMNHREALARMTRSFGLFLFTDKNGMITLRFINASDPDRPILDDVQDIYVKSETHMLARPIVNKVKLQYNRMFSDQSWQGLLDVDDDDAIESLQRTEARELKLFFVRDDFVADSVARDFLQFTSTTSFRIVMTIPGHRRTADVELAQLVGITNYSGLDPVGFGYDNKEFLIHKTEFRTDSKQLRVHAVARAEPPVLGLTEGTALEIFTVVAADGLNEPGAWLELTGRPALDDGFVNPVVLPFTPKWVTIQVQQGFGGFPGVPFPTVGLLDFGVGVPGNVTTVLDEIGITIDATGVDAATGRWYSFPYVGQGEAAFRKGKRLFVRARDNQDGPAESAPQTHNWSGDITLWR